MCCDDYDNCLCVILGIAGLCVIYWFACCWSNPQNGYGYTSQPGYNYQQGQNQYQNQNNHSVQQNHNAHHHHVTVHKHTTIWVSH